MAGPLLTIIVKYCDSTSFLVDSLPRGARTMPHQQTECAHGRGFASARVHRTLVHTFHKFRSVACVLYVQFSLHKTLQSMPDHFENASSGPDYNVLNKTTQQLMHTPTFPQSDTHQLLPHVPFLSSLPSYIQLTKCRVNFYGWQQ